MFVNAGIIGDGNNRTESQKINLAKEQLLGIYDLFVNAGTISNRDNRTKLDEEALEEQLLRELAVATKLYPDPTNPNHQALRKLSVKSALGLLSPKEKEQFQDKCRKYVLKYDQSLIRKPGTGYIKVT